MAKKQRYGLNHTREGEEFRGIGSNARIEDREDREKRLRDLPWKKGVAIGAAGGAIAGALSSQTQNSSGAEKSRAKAQEVLDVKKRNYDRHLRRGIGNTTKTPLGTIRDKQAKRLHASGKKLTAAREAYKAAAKKSPLHKRPLIRSIGKGTAVGAGAGLLASMLMEEQSDNEHALEEIFELGIGRDALALVVKKTKKPYRKIFRNPARQAKKNINAVKRGYERRRIQKTPRPQPTPKPSNPKPANPKPDTDIPPGKTDWKKIGIGAGVGALATGGGIYAYKSHKDNQR